MPLKRSKLARKTVLKRKPISVLKRKSKALKRKTKPRKKKIDIWREFLVPDSAYHRYEGLRGVYWYWLSRDVRRSEWEKYGVCITCLEPIEDWRYEDCGHILPASNCGEYLRLNRINLTIQHKKCNNPRFTPHAGVLNAINMDKRHGAGYMERLLSLRNRECKQPNQSQYRELIQALPSYKEKLTTTP